MTHDELLAVHQQVCADSRELLKAKSLDYAGPHDAMANFRVCEALGICDASDGVLVRMADKLSRLATLSSSDPAVADESVRDTILDLINYAVIYGAMGKMG